MSNITIVATVLLALGFMCVEGYAVVWLITKLTSHVIDCSIPDYIMIGAIISVVFRRGYKK